MGLTLGERILAFRRNREMSQEALGEALGVSRQAVSKWESDAGIPELDTLIAMSRLFGVSLGQLLGVEHDVFTQPDGEADQRAQELLRRYVQAAEERQAAREKRQRLGAVIAGCVAVVVLLWAGVFVTSQFRELSASIQTMEERLSFVENQVNYQILGEEGENEQILTSEERLERSVEWDVLDFSDVFGTVQLRLKADLKEKEAEQTVQFVVDWTDPQSGKTGQVKSSILTGPIFTDVVELSMGVDVQISMLVRDGSGTVIKQPLRSISRELEEEGFALTVSDAIWALFDLRIDGAPQRTETSELKIISKYPNLIAPVNGEITVTVHPANAGPEELSEGDTYPLLIQAASGTGEWQVNLIEQTPPRYDLREGEQVTFSLTLTDNRGRTVTVSENFSMEDGVVRLERTD